MIERDDARLRTGESPAPSGERGARLIAIARAALEGELRGSGFPAAPWHGEAWLRGKGATFVTLRQEGQLRGCIGNVEPMAPLIEVHRRNAIGAALRDPRFPPVTAAELAAVEIEVTLLSLPEPMTFLTEEEALAQLRPGIDGLVLEWQEHRSTYLPQVWEQLPDPQEFLASLKVKAGLPADFWHRDLLLAKYRAEHWEEAVLGATIDRLGVHP